MTEVVKQEKKNKLLAIQLHIFTSISNPPKRQAIFENFGLSGGMCLHGYLPRQAQQTPGDTVHANLLYQQWMLGEDQHCPTLFTLKPVGPEGSGFCHRQD